jgi:hypothetical protein
MSLATDLYSPSLSHKQFCSFFRSIKFFLTLDVELFRLTEYGMQVTDATFRTSVFNISDISQLNLNAIESELTNSLNDFNKRGSGWQLGLIKKNVQ